MCAAKTHPIPVSLSVAICVHGLPIDSTGKALPEPVYDLRPVSAAIDQWSCCEVGELVRPIPWPFELSNRQRHRLGEKDRHCGRVFDREAEAHLGKLVQSDCTYATVIA